METSKKGRVMCLTCNENSQQRVHALTSKERDIEMQALGDSCVTTPSVREAIYRDNHTKSTENHGTRNSKPVAANGNECLSNGVAVNASDDPSKPSKTTITGNQSLSPTQQSRELTSSICDESESHDISDIIEDGESPQVILIPLAGQVGPKYSEHRVSSPRDIVNAGGNDPDGLHHHRHVLNGCTICLTRIITGEQITWSSNAKCLHTFHYDCILNWFLAVGRKEQQKRTRDGQLPPDPNNDDHWEQICTFPMLCPCCRQPFVILHKGVDQEKRRGLRSEGLGLDETLVGTRGNHTSNDNGNLDIDRRYAREEEFEIGSSAEESSTMRSDGGSGNAVRDNPDAATPDDATPTMTSDPT